MELPIGFRFMPTDVELVNYLLKKKVMGNLFQDNMFTERDIYAQESPWNVFNDNDPWVQIPGERTKNLYNFASLKFKGKKKIGKKRMARKAGNGTWHAETGSKHIVDRVSGAVIGKKVKFSYVSGDQSLRSLKGHWYMHEYTLTDSSLNTVEGIPLLSSYVLCKITRDDSKLLHIEEPLPSEIEKKRKGAHVSDKEVTDDEGNTGMVFLGESCSTVSQPVLQYSVDDDFRDGFTEEIEHMLMDGHTDMDFYKDIKAFWMSVDDQEYQVAPEELATSDLDLERAARG